MTFKILSLDGGGIRGVLSATILKEVEKTLIEKTGKKLHEYFDLVTGTSTGSILAAGIASGMSASELLELYEKEGENIFPKCVRWQRKWRLLGQLLGNHVLYPHEYGNQGLTNVLKRRLPNKESGEPLTIQDIKETQLLIPAYDVYSRNTTWFNNSSPTAWYSNLELWKICTASSSAPTFFPPYELPYNAEQSLPHIDGGVSANNPALMAIAHALQIERQNKSNFNLNDIAVFSIGTGNTTCPYTYKEVKGWGQLGWAGHLPDMFMSPATQNSEQICYQILGSVKQNYLRLDFDLNERLKGETKPGLLRKTLTKRDKPYNKYIAEQINEYQEVSEEIDNPDNCPELIKAAQCYLECGKVYYEEEKVPVRSAIQRFIDLHPMTEEVKPPQLAEVNQ